MDSAHSSNYKVEEPDENVKGLFKVFKSSCIVEKIAAIYADRLMSDVCLVMNGTEYPAHRLILCASSDVFHIMLMKPQWAESQGKRIELTETPECEKVFDGFLRFFYTGQIIIYLHSLIGILMLADKYNVKDLTSICLEYMREHIEQAGKEGYIVTWFQYALSMAYFQLTPKQVANVMPELWKDNVNSLQKNNFSEWSSLLRLCKNYIKWNFETVANTPDFFNFQPDIFIALLQQNDLVVTNEMTLHNYTVKWLENQSKHMYEEYKAEMKGHCDYYDLVTSTMSHIRFPMMPPRELAQLLLAPLVNKFKDFFIERMAIGVAFHSGEKNKEIQSFLNTEPRCLLFTPRLYTSDNWSSSIIINNFVTYPSYQPRTLVCLTSSSLQEYVTDHNCEWVIDLYPKGLWFQKSYLIGWQGTLTIPEEILKVVRMTITCRNPPLNEGILLKIGVLISGEHLNIEHITEIACHTHTFTTTDSVMTINNLLPYDTLNDICNFLKLLKCYNNCSIDHSLLTGPNKSLKVQIILIPLSKNLSSIDPPYNSSQNPSRFKAILDEKFAEY